MVLNGAPHPYYLAMIATTGSVLGALIGYALGLYGGRPVAQKVFGSHADTLLSRADEFFRRYGSLAILIAAFTPIPYKVFTIAGGLCKMNLGAFIFYSIIGRGGRFFAVTFLLVHFGEVIMENFFELSLLGVALIVAYIFINKKMSRKV